MERLIWLSLCLSAAGCGARPTAVIPSPPDTRPAITASVGSADDLSGLWAQEQLLTASSNAPFVGEVTSVARRVVLVDVVHQGVDVHMEFQLCDITVETSVALGGTEFGDAYVASVPRSHASGRLEGDGGMLTMGPAWEILGATDIDPSTELPLSSDDPRVIDSDDDGFPGVSVRITGIAGGDIYLLQRSWRQLEVVTMDGVTMDGVIRWGVDRVILDATSRTLRNARPSVPSEDPTENTFRSTRVLPQTDCASVLAAGPGIFER